MANDAMPDTDMLGKQISDSTNDLFSERARWVQTWITARALPFIALFTLTLSYYQIGSGEIIIPRAWSLIIAGILLFIFALRAIPYLLQNRWELVFGNYQISLAFLGLLLLLGNSNSDHTFLYWGALLTGFWAVGYIYPRKWSMPGEFALISLMSTGVVVSASPPLPGWLFVLLLVVPVMVYLQLKYQLLKPVLLLAALIVGVLLFSEIRGWQVILAVVAALSLLWVAIYSIGKLNRQDASNFIQSVGIGVISGLIFVIVVVLIGVSADWPLTWWIMLGLFSSIAGFLYKRNGSKLYPLLMLWGTHWSLITLTMTWEKWLKPVLTGDFYGFQIAAIIGSLLLRHLAFRLDNNRMLVWSRIYLMMVAFSMGSIFYDSSDITLFRLIFLLSVFALAIWISTTKNLSKGPPWWKGVVNPRHVVAVRRILRKGGNFIVSIPFIGPTASAVLKTILVLTKLKRDGKTIHSGDILSILWCIFLAIFVSRYIEMFVLSDQFVQNIALESGGSDASVSESSYSIINKAKDMMVTQSTYLIMGLLFGIIALKERQPIYPLLAMVGFMLAPVTMMGGDYTDTAFFWLISLIAATGILSVKELSKQS